MSNKQTVVLNTESALRRWADAWKMCCRILELGLPVILTIDIFRPTRTLLQNNKMWAVLGDIAKQIQWPVDGKMQYIEDEDWKDIITAGLRKNQRIAAGVEGGFVALGQRTSKMKIAEMSEVIEFALWFGTERGVSWGKEGLCAIAENSATKTDTPLPAPSTSSETASQERTRTTAPPAARGI